MQASGGDSSGVSSIILGMAVVALAGMIGAISLLRQVGELGPDVGDIISFEPLDTLSRDTRARITALPANGQRGVACVLDVRTMHAGGGSMVIEARQLQTQTGYRVHWAGVRSSDDSANCGPSADLLLSLQDVEILAMAAGGYGVAAKKLSPGMLWNAPAQ
jgi:hypothetical protein